jgi:hypothetical protein
MWKFIAGVIVGLHLAVATALASDWQAGRGLVGELPTPTGYRLMVWEPEAGIHCYTYGPSIHCIERP